MKPNFTNGQSINTADIVKDIIFYELFRRIKINAFLVILMIYEPMPGFPLLTCHFKHSLPV